MYQLRNFLSPCKFGKYLMFKEKSQKEFHWNTNEEYPLNGKGWIEGGRKEKARSKESLIDYDFLWLSPLDCDSVTLLSRNGVWLFSGIWAWSCDLLWLVRHLWMWHMQKLWKCLLIDHGFSCCFWNTAIGAHPFALLLEHSCDMNKSTVGS